MNSKPSIPQMALNMKSSKEPSEKQLQAQADKLNAQLREIARERGKREREALVGRCFKFRNSFGSDSPRWWLYAKVVDAGEWWPVAVKFQHKSDGCFEFETKEGFTSTESYTSISNEEFDAALKTFRAELDGAMAQPVRKAT